MKQYNLKEFIGGHIIGPFPQSIIGETVAFEVSYKRKEAGTHGLNHIHKESDEYTVLLEGTMLVNGHQFEKDSIVFIKKDTPAKFEYITDCLISVIKIPAAKSDKYLVIEEDNA